MVLIVMGRTLRGSNTINSYLYIIQVHASHCVVLASLDSIDQIAANPSLLIPFSPAINSMGRRRRLRTAYLRSPQLREKKGFHFFKIVSSSAIEDRRLGLPKRFSKEYGRYLSNVAILKGPSGKEWHVELRKGNGEIFLNNGWQEFIEYHSISAGHFLVFRYDGNSYFYVLIFDMSGSEITYELNSKISKQSKSLTIYQVPETEEDSLEMLGTTSHAKQQQNVYLPICGRRSFAKTNITTRRFVADKQQNRAIQAAQSLKPAHPSFIVVMQPSYVNHCYSLLPLSFVNRYLTEKLESVTLEVSDGRTWSVGCLVKQGNSAKLSRGWAIFAKDNHLKEGDVCVFELINKNDTVLKVYIFRVLEGIVSLI